MSKNFLYMKFMIAIVFCFFVLQSSANPFGNLKETVGALVVNKVLEEKEAEKEEKEAQKREEERLEREKIAEEKRQARLAEEKRIADEKAAAEAAAVAAYVFGTKEKPIIKSIYTSKSNQYLPSPDRLHIHLDMGDGVKVRAIKARLKCTDVFDEMVVNTEIVSKTVSNVTPTAVFGWMGDKGPSTAIQNAFVVEMNSVWDGTSKAFGQGGGLDCSVKPTKVVYRN